MRAGTTTDAPVARATVLGAGALWAWDIFNGPMLETSAALAIEGGLGLRWLNGDASGVDFFEAVFDGGRTLATGPEVGCFFTFGRVVAATQLYNLFNSGDDIPGLTGLQVMAGISVTREFVRGNLPARGPFPRRVPPPPPAPVQQE